MKNTLAKIGKKDLEEFAKICDSLFGINEAAFIKEVELIYKWHESGEVPELIKQIQSDWYNSLATKPDYSVYDNIFYLADCFACWKIYSRKYLMSIASNKSLAHKDSHNNWTNFRSIVEKIGDAKTVVDIGCGIGYSTLALREIFPNTNVYGTNLKGTKQWSLCERLGIDLRENIDEIGKTDVVVAFEYFEHFSDPVAHLNYIVESAAPEYFIIANSFGTVSIGHFIQQEYNGQLVDSKGFGRLFNKELRRLGYEKIETTIFNDKPSFWKRK
jgi:SAM-dependent methyltransferase